MKPTFLLQILITGFLLFFPFSSLFADSGATEIGVDNTGTTMIVPVCTATGFEIIGDDEVTVWSSREYTLFSSGYTGAIISPIFTLFYGNTTIDSKEGEKYIRVFSQTGTLRITTQFFLPDQCFYALEKTITVYNKSVLYVYSDDQDLHTDALETLRKKWLLPISLFIPRTQGISPWNTLSEFIYKNLSTIKETSVIILDVDDPVGFISALTKIVMQDPTVGVNLKGALIYIVTSQNKNLIGKLLASYMNHLSLNEFFLIEKGTIDSTLLQLDTILKTGVMSSSVEKITYESTPQFYSLGRLVEFLIYHGVSISLLGVLLSLTVAILVMNFLKQFIGLNIFGMFAPIFLAVSFYFLNPILIVIFLISASFASLAWNTFVKKIYLLYNAKYALILTLYFIFSILLISILIPDQYGIFEKGAFDNIFIIFPFLMVIFSVDKIFNEEIRFWSRASLRSMVHFIIVTATIFFIIRSQTIQYFLLSYTDVIFVILILDVLIGRFTGLQLFEYIRFLPILKDEKEEE